MIILIPGKVGLTWSTDAIVTAGCIGASGSILAAQITSMESITFVDIHTASWALRRVTGEEEDNENRRSMDSFIPHLHIYLPAVGALAEETIEQVQADAPVLTRMRPTIVFDQFLHERRHLLRESPESVVDLAQSAIRGLITTTITVHCTSSVEVESLERDRIHSLIFSYRVSRVLIRRLIPVRGLSRSR